MKVFIYCADPECGRSFGSREVASSVEALQIFGGIGCGGCDCEVVIETKPRAAAKPPRPKKLAEVLAAREAALRDLSSGIVPTTPEVAK